MQDDTILTCWVGETLPSLLPGSFVHMPLMIISCVTLDKAHLKLLYRILTKIKRLRKNGKLSLTRCTTYMGNIFAKGGLK